MTAVAPGQLDAEVWNDLLSPKARTAAADRLRGTAEAGEYARALADLAENASEPLRRRRAAGEALALLGDPRLNPKDPPMVRVPAGPFPMGTRAEDGPRIIAEYKHARVQKRFLAKEMPQHEVETGEFEIGKYPVTNAEYAEFVEATGQAHPASWEGPSYPEGKANHPVVRISHDDAVAYAEWLSRETGRLYPWGSEFDPDRCNTLEGNTFSTLYKRARPVFNVVLRIGSFVVDSGIAGDRFDKALNTTPVGIYPDGASPYGALDMGGNAEEWVADAFSTYPGYPFGDEFDWSAESWVCRGGAWNRPGDVARTARRHGNFVGTGSIGLRVARDVEG
jgi:formylglycine-generating enzyme required for sulfatase activity